MKKVLSNRKEEDKCIPWYFPPVIPDVRLCTPFEARSFKKEIESVAADDCRVICCFIFVCHICYRVSHLLVDKVGLTSILSVPLSARLCLG